MNEQQPVAAEVRQNTTPDHSWKIIVVGSVLAVCAAAVYCASVSRRPPQNDPPAPIQVTVRHRQPPPPGPLDDVIRDLYSVRTTTR